MGLVFGKINEETPKYEVVEKGADFEVRQYAPYIVAETEYEGGHFKQGGDSGFMLLASYIGVLSKPKNTARQGEKPEKIAMTAPVLTGEAKTEGKPEKIAMTAPVLTESSEGKKTAMQFVLPSKFTMENVPKPTDPRVAIKQMPGRTVGVITFNGNADEKSTEKQANKLREALEKAGYKITGDMQLARYNAPFVIPAFRTNEVFYPVEK